MSEKSNIKKLVSSAKKGNQQAFNTLYDLTKNAVYYTCSSLLKNSEDVQDLCQDVFLAVFQKLNTLDNEENFCGWVKQIAVHKCFNFNRGKVEYQIEDEVLTNEVETNEVMLPEEYITNNSKREIILQLMSDTLTHSQYVTVFLFYFDELSISEISEVLEVSEGTVKSRLNSSRKKMKTAIEKYEEENNDRLHGVVFVPLFGSIFKEEAKNLTVPKIDLVLPKQGSNSIASFGAESAVKTVSKGLVSSVAKTRVIAMLLGITVICGTSISTGVLAGCGKEDLPIATNASTTEVTTEPTEETKPTVSEEVKEAVKDNGLKVNDKGEVVDAKGNKVEVKDGKVEVKTDDGKKVTIKVDEVKEVTQPTKGGSSEPKETQPTTKKPATQPTTKKPATSNTKPATPTTTQKPTEKEKVWVDDYKEVKTWVEPVTEKVWVDDYKEVKTWVEPVTHEEPIYKNTIVHVCNQCGAEFSDTQQLMYHHLANEDTCWSAHTETRKVQTGTTTVVDKEGYYKTEKVKDGGHYETKVVKEGYYKTEKVKDGGHWEYK